MDVLQDQQTNEVLFGGAAGGGKSRLGCCWLLICCIAYPRTRWVMGRAVLKTLKETTLNSFWEVCTEEGLINGVHYRYNDVKSLITFNNGSEIMLKDLAYYPSDPLFSELGSLEITGAFVDECNQTVKMAWNILKSRIRYKLDAYNLIPKILGTCNPDKGWIYQDFYLPNKNGELPSSKIFIRSLLSDNPQISRHYRENLLSLDANSKQRLLYGNFEYDDDPTSLIDYNRILDIFSNTFVKEGRRFITCDVARFGSDKTVIGVWNGWRCKMYQYQGQSLDTTVEVIKTHMIRNSISLSNVIADEDGVGGGVVDFLGCKGFVNNSSALENPITREPENYMNLKSQCYYKLADVINSSLLYVDCPDPKMRSETIQELEQVKQHNMDKDRKKAVLPKDKVKELINRSPDYSDTLMMRVWFELRREINWDPH